MAIMRGGGKSRATKKNIFEALKKNPKRIRTKVGGDFKV